MLRRAFTTAIQRAKATYRESVDARRAGPTPSPTPTPSQKEIEAHALAVHLAYVTRATGASNTATEVLFELRNDVRLPRVHTPL